MKIHKLVYYAVLAFVVLAATSVAQADDYDVSGTFGTTNYTGPLDGGSFSGTFSTTLPIATGTEDITTYDIELFTSSDTLLETLTGSLAGVIVQSGNCDQGGGVTGACDQFFFEAADGSFLSLLTPLDFTGGSVYPDTPIGGDYGSLAGYLANSGSTDSIVTSGSIVATPEPGTLSLLGIGAGLVLFAMARRKRLA